MSAFNVVRFRVKPGQEQRFIDTHRELRPKFKGFLRGTLIRTGDQTFCMVGEWRNMQSLATARPEMIGFLDMFRDMLEDLGGGLGVTDPVSGDAVVQLSATTAKKKATRKAAAKAGKKKVAKKSKAKAKSKTKAKKKAAKKKSKKKK